MKTSKTFGIGIASTALVLSFLVTPTADAFWNWGQGNNSEITESRLEEIKQLHEDRQKMKESITRSIELIDNGVIKTLTSSDASVVEKLQSREPKTPQQEIVQRSQENISGGVKIKITSDDAEMVAKIQKRAQRWETAQRWTNGTAGFRQYFGKRRHREVTPSLEIME